MTRRSSGSRDIECEKPDQNIENLNLREAMRQARERTNRERNRAKCKRYYRKRRGKNHQERVGKDVLKEG